MINKCIANNNPKPSFHEIAGAFVITFHKAKNEGLNEGLNGGLNGGLFSLLNQIKLFPGLNSDKLSASLNIPKKTIERWIGLLRKQERIEFRGSKKTGGYFCL